MKEIERGDWDSRTDAVAAGSTETIDASKIEPRHRMEMAMYPEARVSGFPHTDPEVAFYTQVSALLRPEHVVLDFGAGRGSWYNKDPSFYRRWLSNFRGRCAHVDGCDVDPVVMENETLDAAKLLEPGQPLPYEDNRFDLIVSRYVFEHIPDPEWAARELLRVTKPGGWICALTPNKLGYVALAARMVPNRLHAAALRYVQPGRRAEDTFPTVYRLNRPGEIRRHFGTGADVFHYSTSAVPSYHFGRKLLFRVQSLLHRVLPAALDLRLAFFIRKR